MASSSPAAPGSARPGWPTRSSSSPKRPNCRAPAPPGTPRASRSPSPRLAHLLPSDVAVTGRIRRPRPGLGLPPGAGGAARPGRRPAPAAAHRRRRSARRPVAGAGGVAGAVTRRLRRPHHAHDRGPDTVRPPRQGRPPAPAHGGAAVGGEHRDDPAPGPRRALVAESLARLRDLAMGNPGVLRQLVESAREAGTLLEHDGVWRLVGPLRPTPSFEDLVADRLRGLDDAHQPRRRAARRGRRDRPRHRRPHRRPRRPREPGAPRAADGPLLGAAGVGVARPSRCSPRSSSASCRALRGRRLRRQLADAVEAVGARRRDDKVRLVAWRVDAGGDVDPEHVLNAARLALVDGDDVIAERLIERAVAARVGARASELLAELHFRRDEPEQLEAVLARIDLSELDEADAGASRPPPLGQPVLRDDRHRRGARRARRERRRLHRPRRHRSHRRPAGDDPVHGGPHRRSAGLQRAAPGQRR